MRIAGTKLQLICNKHKYSWTRPTRRHVKLPVFTDPVTSLQPWQQKR